MNIPGNATAFYKTFKVNKKITHNKLSIVYRDFVKSSDQIGIMISRVELCVGQTKPKDQRDVIVRDLLADSFDNLYEARERVLEGQLSIAYSLARRGCESLAILMNCSFDKGWAKEWATGKKNTSQASVFRKLKTSFKNYDKEIVEEFGQEYLKELDEKLGSGKASDYAEFKKQYDGLSKYTHSNMWSIGRRFHGEPFEYVLMNSIRPDVEFSAHLLIAILEMQYRLLLTISWHYRKVISENDLDLITKEAIHVHKSVELTTDNLKKQFSKHWEESKENRWRLFEGNPLDDKKAP